MSAYSPEDWSDFLVASSGASAALAGLVFIGISINVTRIVAVPGLASRAGQTIIVLANALAISLAVLGPQRSHVGVGIEILVLGVTGWLAVVRMQRGAPVEPARVRERRRAWILLQVATVPFIIGGLSTLIEVGGGLYWMQAGVVLALLVGLTNGWVLLVEILR